jgi:hypothetical protein
MRLNQGPYFFVKVCKGMHLDLKVCFYSLL